MTNDPTHEEVWDNHDLPDERLEPISQLRASGGRSATTLSPLPHNQTGDPRRQAHPAASVRGT